MNIAIVVSRFPPKWLGGTEIAACEIAQQLSNRGHEIHVITSRDRGICDQNVYRYKVHRLGVSRIRFVETILFWIKSTILLWKISPDLVHIQSIPTAFGVAIAYKWLKIPFIVWGQGSDVYQPWIFKKFISGIVLSNADTVLALSHGMAKIIKESHSVNVRIIPNGVNLDKFKLLNNLSSSKKQSMPGTGNTLLFVGRLYPVKGIEYLIQAMKLVTCNYNNDYTDIRLILVGGGPEQDALKHLVAELNLTHKVLFKGQVTIDEIPRYMSSADIFILPSLSEGLPLVILEAMASGLPIIASNVGGISEIIMDGVNGFLVEPKEPEQLAERINTLLSDNLLRYRMSKNNVKRIKDYSWDRVIDELEDMYHSVVNKFPNHH